MVWTSIYCFYSKKKKDSCRHKSKSWLFFLGYFICVCANEYIFLVCQGVLLHMDPPSLWRSRDGAGSFLFLYLCIYYFRLILQLLYCEQLCWWITNSLNCRFIAHNSSSCISARILGSILSSDRVFLEYVVLLMRHPGRLDFNICHVFMAKGCAAFLVTI